MAFLMGLLGALGSAAKLAAPSLIGAAAGKLGGTEGGSAIDVNQIKASQDKSQGLVDEQLGLSRQLMDPQSAMNLQMQNMLSQNASQQGAQVGTQMEKLGAMRNMSPAQIMMQSRMGMNQSMGGVNQQWLKSLTDRFDKGTGIMGRMTTTQRGLDENLGNAYLSNLNMANRDKAGSSSGMLGGLLEGVGGEGLEGILSKYLGG